MNESALDIKKTWYFGNNRSKNLKISPPKWSAPFFLTTSIEYAEEYSDYGVYKIDLKSEARSRILDFNKSADVKKFKWPKVLIDKIREGRNDLNSIAYDMYILAYNTGDQLMYIEDNAQWTQAVEYFKKKSKNIFVNVDITSSVWGSEKDHQFLLQMWKDIYDAGFDGFMHVEFGSEVLAIFTFQCIDQISVKPVSQSLNEKMKSRALKKAFKAKGQAAFPEIKTDDDIVFVSDIPKEKALNLLNKACHDVSNFHPEYMEKAVKWSDDQIFGVFNKHDKRNVLAMASVSYNGDKSGAAYLHEMTGFIKGGYGKKLVMWLLQKFKKVYGQIALEGSGTKDDPYKPNEKLRDKFYATIPGLKIYRVKNSVWDCPADFFYYGISDESIKEFLEKTYRSKEHNAIDESTLYRNTKLSYYDVYMKSHPIDNISSLLDELVSEFAKDMQYCGISITDELSQQIYQKNGYINEHILDKIAKKMTRRYIWRKIKADVYAAIVSRFVNVMQQTNNQELLENNVQFSHMVSKKTIEDCLDIICHNVNVLDANAILTTSLDIDLALSIFKKHDLVNDIMLPHSNKTYEDCSIAAVLYSIWASFAPGINTKYMCRSANAPDKIRDILSNISYDASRINLIIALNRALDVVHSQNDLSLAFIEGGKQTLSKVSSLKLDQIYESTHISQTMYRFSIDNIGVYEAAKDFIFSKFDADEAKKKWSKVLTASSWLPKPNFQYSKEYESWFTLAGKNLFEKTVLRILRSLGIDNIKLSESIVDDSRIVYSDIYQAIVKLDRINEDNETSINSIKHMFDEVVSQYKILFDIDLSYMKFKVDSQPVYTNGEPCYEYDEDECAGDWTSLGWIRLNPDMRSVMDRYGVAWHGSNNIEEFTKFIIAHELAHEVWNNIADDQFKNYVIEKANDENFNTVYLETVNSNKLAEETFCEYLAHEIVQQRKKISFPEEEIQDLSRRKHIVTHRVSDDALLFNVGDIVDTPWQIPYKVAGKVVVNDIYDSPYIDQLSKEQLEYLQQFDNIAILDLDAQYDPPYTLEQIKAHYPENIYVELANDPVHRWRAETGIELIHKEPTEEELDRIWKNWQLMTQKMKDISDKKSIELFGCTNSEHYKQLSDVKVALNENKTAYLQKYKDEADAKKIVNVFWQIKNHLKAPQNDIDWWIKKPFQALKDFVQSFDMSNKRQRRDAEYRRAMVDNDAKMLGSKDGYEIWYVPTYEAMRTIGRFYKGISTTWCVASDDPSFWFDMHDMSEFIVLVRENPQNDEFDKIAIEMQNGGRRFDVDEFVMWDAENEDDRFCNDDLMHYAWELFVQNGEIRRGL